MTAQDNATQARYAQDIARWVQTMPAGAASFKLLRRIWKMLLRYQLNP